MSYAPPVISGGGATAGAGPAGSEFVAPAAAFAGQGFLAPGPAWGGSDPGVAPVPTQATIQLPPQPEAAAASPPPPAPQGGEAPPPPPRGGAGTSPVLRRKCLLVACNYQGTSAALKGCGNDQQCMRHCLKTRFGYRDEEILALFDAQPDPRLWPTRANILAAMRWLVADARAGDSLFFHYSGHGAQTQDWSGDEADGYNEVSGREEFPLKFSTLLAPHRERERERGLVAAVVVVVVVCSLSFSAAFRRRHRRTAAAGRPSRRPRRTRARTGLSFTSKLRSKKPAKNKNTNRRSAPATSAAAAA